MQYQQTIVDNVMAIGTYRHGLEHAQLHTPHHDRLRAHLDGNLSHANSNHYIDFHVDA